MSLAFSRYNVWATVGERSAVFNGVSGGMVVMSADERAQIETFVAGGKAPDNLERLLRELAGRRMIVSEDYDERNELRRRYDDSRWRSSALGYTVVTSLGCNFDCPYCFEDKKPSLLKPAVADALVRILVDSLPTIEKLTVTWMGGEPLLGKEHLLDLSSRLIAVCDEHEKEYSASIITNGWFLDGATAQALAAARVRSAQVTIDGPPDVHDAARPHVSGAPTFERVLANVCEAADHIDIFIRVNVNRGNAHRGAELLAMLAEAGLSNRVRVGLGRITDAVGNTSAPLAGYSTPCMTAAEFGDYELAFNALAHHYGFGQPSAPKPVGTPCTAVRSREVVVGSDGELWKCWDDIGNADQSIGTVFDYTTTNDRLDRWFQYHPADDPQCSTCIAMPVCMGGCAHHFFNSDDREARCGGFRHNHVGRITRLLEHQLGIGGDVESLLLQVATPLAAAERTADTPVVLGPRRARVAAA